MTVHDGGMSTALRDLARFGLMLADGGRAVNGEQVLPAWWVSDTLTGDPGSGEAFAASPTDTGMPGGMYRNTFWVLYPGGGCPALPGHPRPAVVCRHRGPRGRREAVALAGAPRTRRCCPPPSEPLTPSQGT